MDKVQAASRWIFISQGILGLPDLLTTALGAVALVLTATFSQPFRNLYWYYQVVYVLALGFLLYRMGWFFWPGLRRVRNWLGGSNAHQSEEAASPTGSPD